MVQGKRCMIGKLQTAYHYVFCITKVKKKEMCPYLNFGNKQGYTKVMKVQVIKAILFLL